MTARYEISGPWHRVVMEGTGSYSNIYNWWRNGTWYELPLLTYWTTLPAPDVYIDVGAHCGNHTVFAAKQWPNTRIVAYEPDPTCWALLVKNVIRNGVPYVQCRNAAAWYDNGRAHLVVVGEDEGQKAIAASGGTEVDTERIDNAVGGEGRSIVIKIDTEGQVAPVLDGAASTLANHDCRLFIEGDPLTLTPLLEDYGYALTGKVWGATPLYEATRP